MRAVVIRKHGDVEVLEIADLPKPKAGHGEILLRVEAAGLNHLDTWVRRGLPGMTHPLPMILGSDGAGVVEETGPGVLAPKPGDRVFVSPGYSCGRCIECASGLDPLCKEFGILGEHRNGVQAEYVVLPAHGVLSLPDGLSFEEAAAFPLVFLTAWHMLVGRARVRVGDDVLVHAGGSGVGTAAIQVARIHGARVITTVGSDDKVARVKGLGADEAINYRTTDFLDEVRRTTGKRGVDIVIDSVGQETWEKSLKALARGGRLVTCGSTSGYQARTDLRYVFSKGLSILGSTMGGRAELLRVARLIGERRLKPVIDRVLPLGNVADGHRIMAGRGLFGKIVLTP